MKNNREICRMPSTDSDALDAFTMELQSTAKREFWPYFSCARYTSAEVLKLSNEWLTAHVSVFSVKGGGHLVALYMKARGGAVSWQQLTEAGSLSAIRNWMFQYSN